MEGFEKHALIIGSVIIGSAILSYKKYGGKGLVFVLLAVVVISKVITSNFKNKHNNEQINATN